MNKRSFIEFMNHFAEKREKSKELIMQTALELFAENGYEKASIRAIAKQAGISLGLLYNYYENKDALLYAIFEQSQKDIRESFEALNQPDLAPAQKLEQHIRVSIQIVKKHHRFWKLLHGIRMQSSVVRKLMQELKSENDFIEKQISQYLLELGISFPNMEAKLLFASIDGIVNHYLLFENYPIDDVAELLIRKYIK